MIRVLAAIVVPPHLSVSGGVRAGEMLSQALAAHCDVQVASMMGAGSSTARHIPVRVFLPPVAPWSRLPNRYRTLFYRSDIPELIGRERYDLVHIHNPTPGLEMERIATACRRAGVPYVVSTHGYNEVANGHRVHTSSMAKRLAWQKLAYEPVARVTRGAAAIFALSPADIPIVRAMGFAGGSIPIVPNGVVPPSPADAAADRAVWEKFGLTPAQSPDTFTCMFLGNHTPNKGLPVLLEACRALERPFNLIVGGEQRSGIDYAGAIDTARPGQRIIVTGRLSDGEVSALMRRSNLFVFPTLADTLPLVVLEAMAHGLPVLASRVGGIPFLLGTQSGVTVEPGDPAALAAALDDLARDSGRLAIMGGQARSRAMREFTWERAASCALAGYDEVLGRAPAAQAA